MLPTHTIKHPPQRRNRPQPRGRPTPLGGSGSIFSTIRKLVTAPLNWFSVNQEFEDFDGKRRINGRGEGRLAGYTEGSQAKKMRVDAPIPMDVGYLDPPSSTFEPSGLSVPVKQLTLDSSSSSFDKYIPRTSPFKDRRNMSIDPIPRDTTVPRDPPMSRDPSRIPMPRDSSVEMWPSMSVARESSMHPPPTPFRLRTSLTPKPSPTKPLRREASAPPPLASLISHPIFVKPPLQGPSAGRKLADQTTVSLGSLVEARRASRSPTRDRIITNVAPVTRFPSQIPYGNTDGPVRVTNAAGKLLYDLDIYKTPILPSRYKDAKVIPDFLKAKKSHVPIPMSRKGREIKPSLGMAQKAPLRTEDKPYAGQGGLRALLARRKAEEDEERTKAEDALKEPKSKKDVGVSAKFTSDSEEEHKQRKSKVARAEAPPPPVESEISSYGRERASGRIGPTRISRREGRIPPAFGTNRKNKFSAVFDDDDCMIGDQSEDGVGTSQKPNLEPTKVSIFAAPSGFSFAKDTAPIAHDHNNAKEPPLSSLPFSLSYSVQPSKGKENIEPSTASGSMGSIPPVSNEPRQAPFSFVKPAAAPDSLPNAPKPPSFVPSIPSFALSPPTPEPPKTIAQKVEPMMPAASSSPTPSFFANSALLDPKPADAPKPTPSPAIPVKDAENPFWDGDKKPTSVSQPESSSSSLFGAARLAPPNAPASRQRSTSPKPSPFGGISLPTALPKTGPPMTARPDANAGSMFSNQPAQGSPFAFSAPTPAAGKASETSVAAVPAPVFSFGSKPDAPATSVSAPSTSAGPPGPFGATSSITGGSATSMPGFTFGASSAAPSSPARPATADPTTKPTTGSETPFSFGAPTPRPAVAGILEVPKSPFTFGSVPATPPAQAEKREAFSFGAPAPTSSTSFSFGLSPSNASAAAAKPAAPAPPTSPFSLGAPAQPAPKTPPPQEDNEMRMEESPTRDVNGKANGSDLKVSTGFSFGSASSAPFQSTTGAGFTFGGPLSSNAFDTKNETKSTGFGNFNRTASAPASSTPFSFGQKLDNAAPSGFGATAPSSLFGQPSSSTTPFSFGAPAPASPSNPFAPKPRQAESPAPASPSFGGSTNNFSFAAPSTNISSPFSFGASQPASPAVNNTGLPQGSSSTAAPAPGVFTFGQGTSGAVGTSASPFGAPATSTPGGGGALFNIGAPPPATPGGSRQMKALPRRRPGAKR